jgi:hypothetical protein
MRIAARRLDWDLLRGFHHGQRPMTPREQAGYMSASDRIAATLHKTLASGPSIHDRAIQPW